MDGQSQVDHHIAGREIHTRSALAEPEAAELLQHDLGCREKVAREERPAVMKRPDLCTSRPAQGLPLRPMKTNRDGHQASIVTYLGDFLTLCMRITSI